MKVFPGTFTRFINSPITYESLTKKMAEAETIEEAMAVPWQLGPQLETTLLGIINGVLEETTGMVLTAVIHEESDKFEWWCLRKVWWDQP